MSALNWRQILITSLLLGVVAGIVNFYLAEFEIKRVVRDMVDDLDRYRLTMDEINRRFPPKADGGDE